MNLLNYVMVRQERDAGNKFTTSKVTHTQDFYRSAVLSWVVSPTSKSEDKEQVCSWVEDHTDAVENAASLFIFILNHCPSRIAESTALLTQNILWATYEKELGGITLLEIHLLILWWDQVIFGIRLSPCSVEWPQYPWKVCSFTYFQSVY